MGVSGAPALVYGGWRCLRRRAFTPPGVSRRPRGVRHREPCHSRENDRGKTLFAPYRTSLRTPVTPLPEADGGTRVLSRCLPRRSLLDRFRRTARHRVGYIPVHGAWVRTTHRPFGPCATPTLGLGWCSCSTVALRRRPNAAGLLVSGGHPYSLAILAYYGPRSAFTVAETRR